MIFWNTLQPYYGFILDSANIYNKIFNLNNLLNDYPYLYYEYENGIILRRYYKYNIQTLIETITCSRYLDSILYTNYNPVINISYISSYRFFSDNNLYFCLLYTSPSPRDRQKSRMPSSA